MADYWLLKSEPGDYSYADLERDGHAIWDGVRNPAALKHIRQLSAGDQAFFYHTGKERAVVGIVQVESEAYPDPDAGDERLVVFEVSPLRRLPQPVSLARIKASEGFESWELVRVPRLSVMPVPKRLWLEILSMSEP
ncbi:MAG: EVE domain-containing protein [Gemmatimonadota bacterium]